MFITHFLTKLVFRNSDDAFRVIIVL